MWDERDSQHFFEYIQKVQFFLSHLLWGLAGFFLAGCLFLVGFKAIENRAGILAFFYSNFQELSVSYFSADFQSLPYAELIYVSDNMPSEVSRGWFAAQSFLDFYRDQVQTLSNDSFVIIGEDFNNDNTIEPSLETVPKPFSPEPLTQFHEGLNGGVNNKELFEELVEEIQQAQGVFGLYIKDLSSGSEYKYNADESFFGASLYKVPVAVSVLKQIEDRTISLEDEVSYLRIDFYGGTGSINTYPYGTRFTVKELLDLLLKQSDNVAQNMLVRYIGLSKIEEGFSNISGNPGSIFFEENITTPVEVGSIFEHLFLQIIGSNKNYYLGNDGSSTIIKTMFNTYFDDRISSGLNSGLSFSHKIGSWGNTGSWHDCGIVYDSSQIEARAVVCLMSKNTTYAEFVSVAEKVGNYLSNIIAR